MTEPVRRQIEQPTEESQKRSGCLLWGAVLGVLVGIMLGIYALPPILKHYYGETVVGPGETYESGGRRISVISVSHNLARSGSPSDLVRRAAFDVTLIADVNEEWRLPVGAFTLEFEELDQWQSVSSHTDEPLHEILLQPGTTKQFELQFVVETGFGSDKLTPKALHLSDPRVKFEIE